MDPISQGAVGAATAQGLLPRSLLHPANLRVAALLGCLAGMAPDLDVFISSPTDSLLFLEYHRQFTHALVFVPVGAAIVAAVAYPFLRRRLSFGVAWLVCLVGYGSHGLLDACTSYGTQLFWPFSNHRVAWNNVAVVDPFFTLPLLVLLGIGVVRRSRRFTVAGLVWGFAYLGAGVVQNQRAEATGREMAAMRGHEPQRLGAKPGFANLLVWKVVYEHDGRYHIDAVRTGFRSTVCPGSSVPVLDIAEHLPWVDPASQQARDIERFRWFSSDYLTPDPVHPNRVIDARYSLVPNRIDPLWGIELAPDAPANRHVLFVADRAADAEEFAALGALFSGEGCHGVESAAFAQGR